jgi:hypothetical protein
LSFLSLSPATLFKASEHDICVVLREVRFAKHSEPSVAVSLVALPYSLLLWKIDRLVTA